MTVFKDAFPNASSAISAFTGVLKNGDGIITAFKSGLSGLWKVISANPIGAIGAIATVVSIVSNVVSHYNKKAEEIKKATLESGDTAKKEADNVLDLYSAYQQNRQAYISNAGSKDALTSSTDALLSALGIERSEIQNLAEEYQSLDAAINHVTENALLQESTKISAAYGESIDSLKETYEDFDPVIKFRGNTDKKLKEYLQNNNIPLAYGGVYDSSLNTIDLYGIEKYEAVYDELVKIQELAQKSITDGVLTQDDVSDSGFLREIEMQKKSLEEQLNIAHGYRDTLNQIQSQIIFNDISGKIGIPKNQESFNSFRDAMLEAAIAGDAFLGTEQDIEHSIDNFLSSMPALSNFSDHLTNTATATAEQLSSLKEGFENSDVSKWFDSLSEDQKQLVFDISVRSDNSNLWTLEKWKSELEHLEKHGISSQESLSSFYTALNGSDDQNGFTATIENYISNIETLQESLSKIDSGEFNSADKLNLIKEFPSLAQYADDTDNLREAVSNLIGETSQGIDDAFNEQLKSMGEDGSTAYQSMSNLQSIVQSICKIDGWNFDLEAAKAGIDNLYSAMKESVTSTGLTSESIENLQSRYQNLENYNAAHLFEKTTNGIHLNTKALQELESAYEKQEKSKIDNTLDNLVEQYNSLTEEINKADNASSSAELYAKRADILDQINDTAELASQYEGLTSAFHQWEQAQSIGEEGDIYDSLSGGLENIKELYDQGLVGTNKFRAAVQLMSNQDLSNASIDELVAAYESGYATMTRYFTDSSDGCVNFLNDIQNLNSEWAHMNEDGSWDIDFGLGNDQEIADALGINVESVQSIMRKLSDYGFDINLDSIYSSFDLLSTKAEEANDKLKELGKTDYTFNFETDDIDYLHEQIEESTSLLDEFKDSKGNFDLELDGAEEVQTILTSLLSRKQEISAPEIMQIDTSAIANADTEIANAISLLQSFIQYSNDLEIQTALGIDTTDTQQKLQNVATALGEVPDEVKTTLGINDESFKTHISNISNTKINVKAGVTISADDIASVQASINGIKAKNIQMSTNSSSVTRELKNVDRYTIGNKSFSVTIKNNPLTTLSNINSYVIKDKSYKVTTYSNSVKTGTGKAQGTACANGNWGTKDSGVALGGEIDRELIVRDGRFFTIGDDSAEFFHYKKNDIIFNAEQTKQILKNGKITNGKKRGVSYAEGTAFSNGSGSFWGGASTSNTSSGGSSSSSSSGKSSSSSSNSNSNKENEPETIDWIEIAIDRIERAINRLKTTAESTYKALKTKLGATADEITKVNEEISLQEKAYDRYIQQANSVGLSSDLAEKVRNGAIDISEYDDETAELIKKYQDWYEKAINCSDAVQELHEDLASLYEDNFNNIQDDYDNQLSLLENLTNTYKTGIDVLKEKGYIESTKYYSALQDVEKKNIAVLNNELADLQKTFSEAMNSGEIEKYSDTWYSMQIEINDVKESIDKANLSLLEYAKTIREINWDNFDYIQKRISQITSEADFFIDLMKRSNLYEDNGQFNDIGMATTGLHAQNYNVYMAQSDKYAKEILALDKEIANDPYNKDLIERREKLLELQQESILSAESEKQAIIELVEEGINIELDSLKELIDAYKDSLDEAKDLYDYQKKVEQKAKDIASLEKQLSAYENDASEETRAKIQQIKVDLSEARADLAETEYDKFISDTNKLLDEFYDDYESILNERLDNIDALISDMIDAVNLNSTDIRDTLTKISDEVGYKMTQDMKDIWNHNGTSDIIVSMYDNDFAKHLTSINLVLNNIESKISEMIKASDIEAALVYQDDNIHSNTSIVSKSSDAGTFINLKNILDTMAEQNTLSLGIPSYNVSRFNPSNISDISKMLAAARDNNKIVGNSIGEVNVTIPIEHVEDYNDFVKQLQKDERFEKMIRSMTTDRLVGRSSISKYKYNWNK